MSFGFGLLKFGDFGTVLFDLVADFFLRPFRLRGVITTSTVGSESIVWLASASAASQSAFAITCVWRSKVTRVSLRAAVGVTSGSQASQRSVPNQPSQLINQSITSARPLPISSCSSSLSICPPLHTLLRKSLAVASPLAARTAEEVGCRSPKKRTPLFSLRS